MELNLQSLFGLHVHSVLIGRDQAETPQLLPSPRIWAHIRWGLYFTIIYWRKDNPRQQYKDDIHFFNYFSIAQYKAVSLQPARTDSWLAWHHIRKISPPLSST
jgi:hypothetical protein